MVNAIMLPARVKAFASRSILFGKYSVPVPVLLLSVCISTSVLLVALRRLAFTTVPPDTQLHSHAAPECFFNAGRSCSFDYAWAAVSDVLTRARVKNRTWGLADNEPLTINSRQINVLYFNERKEYLEKMDRYFYDEVRAANSHPQLLVRLWGPGWFGYDNALTASENIVQAFADIEFDIIYTKTWHHNITSETAVVIHATGDCHNKKCITDPYYPTFADAITYRYAGLILEFSRPEQWKARESERVKKLNSAANLAPMPFFFHSPDCADEAIMHPLSLPLSAKMRHTSLGDRWASTRNNPIFMIGHPKGWLYPLRAKVKDGIESGKIQNARVYKHVGYVLESETGVSQGKGKNGVLGVFDPNDPDVEHQRKNQREWANALATTQICVFDSSVVRKAIRKYQESFMSGCVVAADIPLEMEEMFRNVVIPLRADMSVQEINQVLQEYLQDKERLAWMAVEAFKRARMHWTCRNKVDRLLEAAERVVRGERGYWFPFGFSSTCRRFGKDDKWISDWCKPGE
ncbi:hypothetical protein CcCBS67573_g06582 [Chytriomyces confervae]|uniref:Uncharacterized protein n=1 Tax=Chytriomyces confervae TaxID=246404 RepID=A0A507F3V0_9FUNG|nr:hypothetical protein HDU80_004190 [Chytriomyces hyalinus]TPX70300.1 hypothetical protein CcCBS67573_g06582 [Chytriomyces confervae]